MGYIDGDSARYVRETERQAERQAEESARGQSSIDSGTDNASSGNAHGVWETGPAPEDNPFGKLSLDVLRQQRDEYAKGVLDAVRHGNDLYEQQVRGMLAVVNAEIECRLDQSPLGKYGRAELERLEIGYDSLSSDRASLDCEYQLLVERKAYREMEHRIHFGGYRNFAENIDRLLAVAYGQKSDFERKRDADPSIEREAKRASKLHTDFPVGKERDVLMEAAGRLSAIADAMRARDPRFAGCLDWEVIRIHERVFYDGLRRLIRQSRHQGPQ